MFSGTLNKTLLHSLASILEMPLHFFTVESERGQRFVQKQVVAVDFISRDSILVSGRIEREFLYSGPRKKTARLIAPAMQSPALIPPFSYLLEFILILELVNKPLSFLTYFTINVLVYCQRSDGQNPVVGDLKLWVG